MESILVHGRHGPSRILVGERLENVSAYLPEGKQVVVVTDGTVRRICGNRLPPAEVVTIGEGEGEKTLETVAGIYRRLMDLGADRSTFVLAVGGGVVCDVAGFAASTFMRGLDFGFVATTLLAQVDASVGGKNGVNLDGFKNMVGVFRQPSFVLCDPRLLTTLPPREIRSGFGEIVKHAAIASSDKFDFLESHWEEALALESEVVERLVAESVRIKAAVVSRDETEQGERRKLNFGHTIGHAVERAAGLAHGEAVSVGMRAAADLSVQRGLLEPDAAKRLEALLRRMELPTRIPIEPSIVVQGLSMDKKRERDSIRFVLLDRIGHAVVESVPIGEVERFLLRAAAAGAAEGRKPAVP